MLQRLFGKNGMVVTTNPAVTLIDIKAEQVIYLITQPGHFAHPSIIQRSLVMRESVKAVQVEGFTATWSEIMFDMA